MEKATKLHQMTTEDQEEEQYEHEPTISQVLS